MCTIHAQHLKHCDLSLSKSFCMNQWIRLDFHQTYRGWLVVMIIDNHLECCICSKTVRKYDDWKESHQKAKMEMGTKMKSFP